VAESTPASEVPDVLGPGLACVFCGINPGRVSAAAAAHFANPRNDFWRLLHDAGFTPRLLEPAEQFSLLELGFGITNAAYRTTPGSGDLRRGDFDAGRLERLAAELRPLALAFVGKEAYRGVFGERPELGPQSRSLGSTGLFVLPSTSPANAAVPYEERLRWFRELRAWIEPVEREATRGVVLDRDGRVLLVRFEHPVSGAVWWATAGGGVDEGESDEEALRRELLEEAGLREFEIGPLVHLREHTFSWAKRLIHQRERYYLVRVDRHVPAPTIDLAPEGLTEVRWWTQAELADPVETVVPGDLLEVIRANDPEIV
jgi:G:T/U-mismatch repair DNA glycosylase/ADP-ribose pyrophosphatase YjhB (NUDIX family)